MKKFKLKDRFLIWASGYELATLSLATPNEINKIKMIGSMVVVPAFVALFSYGYAAFIMSGLWYIGLLAGLIGSILILMLDRAIVGYSKAVLNWGTIGRVGLAITVGFLVAEPAVLLIFKDSIDENLSQQLYVQQHSIDKSYDNRISDMNKEMNKRDDKLNNLQKAYTSEMDGTGGSGLRDQGPIYRKKLKDYNDYKSTVKDKNKASLDLIASIEKERSQHYATIKTNQGTGILGRMRALERLKKEESIVGTATWFLRGFFFLIELIPLFIKLTPRKKKGKPLIDEMIDRIDNDANESHQALSEDRKRNQMQHNRIQYLDEFLRLKELERQKIVDNKLNGVVDYCESLSMADEFRQKFERKILRTIKEPDAQKTLLERMDLAWTEFATHVDQMRREDIKSTSNITL